MPRSFCSTSKYVFNKIKSKAERFRNPQIAFLGLTFKQDIDDLRESPALDTLKRLISAKVGNIIAVEPNIEELPDGLEGVTLDSYEQAINNADIVAVLVKHKEFSLIDPQLLKDKILLDFVNAI